MLHATTLERLRDFRLSGFIDALATQAELPQYRDLPFEERLTLLTEAEHSRRCQLRTQRLVKTARLSLHTTLAEVDFSIPRMLDRRKLLDLCQASWLNGGHNLIIMGPTGVGKTFIASVIAHALCAKGIAVRFQHAQQWLADLLAVLARKRLQQAITRYRNVPLLVFDEWMRDPISPQEARVLLDLFDDRYGPASCLFIAQTPIGNWHQRFEDPTLADAIFDRITHCSTRLVLSGESVRKLKAEKETSLHSENSKISFDHYTPMRYYYRITWWPDLSDSTWPIFCE
jgi:DNA replication protein DnaC